MHKVYGAYADDWCSTCPHNHYYSHNLSLSQPEPWSRSSSSHILTKTAPNSSSGLCLFHDYEMILYFAELVLLFKNLIDHNIMFRLSRLADGAPCNCFCRLCCEFCPLYALIEQSPQDCPHFRCRSQVQQSQGYPHFRPAGYKSEGLHNCSWVWSFTRRTYRTQESYPYQYSFIIAKGYTLKSAKGRDSQSRVQEGSSHSLPVESQKLRPSQSPCVTMLTNYCHLGKLT